MNLFLVDRERRQTELKLPEFLTTNLRGKVMTQIKLRPLSRHYELVTYKVGLIKYIMDPIELYVTNMFICHTYVKCLILVVPTLVVYEQV